MKEKIYDTMRKIYDTAKPFIAAGLVASWLGVMGYELIVSRPKWEKEQYEQIMNQNPDAVESRKFFKLYGFDDNGDGSTDRIEVLGTFAPGPRPGVPGRLRATFYRVRPNNPSIPLITESDYKTLDDHIRAGENYWT
ncbi:hypothetical protein HYW21_01715 [Candidatus Woesearchaeota archaeon]|nr:hypothetical protein [Candidatus Woesearchaeota archaeon]